MGKVDDLRALREARFEASQKGAKPTIESKSAKARKALQAAVAGPAPITGALCGHRSVGGKSCIREEGHVATGTKSHRYAKTEKPK